MRPPPDTRGRRSGDLRANHWFMLFVILAVILALGFGEPLKRLESLLDFLGFR